MRRPREGKLGATEFTLNSDSATRSSVLRIARLLGLVRRVCMSSGGYKASAALGQPCNIPHDTTMSPIATQTLVDTSTGVHKQALPRKPRVYSLEPLHSRALALAREKFDLVLPNEPGFEAWRTEAEGLMARNAEVSASDTRVLKSNKLRYISKQGVGVDNFDLDELKKCDIPLMNTPGVNVSSDHFHVRDELICQTTAVAELALGLILDVARRVSTIDAMIRDGKKVTKLDGWSGQVSRCNRFTGVVPS